MIIMPNDFVSSNFHLPYNKHLVTRAKELRRNMTAAEKKLWYECLRTFPLRVLRQKPIDNFIVDFYCAKLKLVIEVDGESHCTDAAKVKDEERTKILQGYGLTVIRFTNNDVLESCEDVCQSIHSLIESPPASYPPL